MPVECSQSVLTGQDGSVYFKPAGTEHCLLDLTDFPAGPGIVTVPVAHDFRPGDPIIFRPEGGQLDTGLSAGTVYFVGLTTPTTIQVLPTLGSILPVTLAGDGGAPASSSGSILTLGTPVPGAGYQPGTYNNVPFTQGSGTGALGNIVVGAGGTVSSVVLVTSARGRGYRVGDVLSASNVNLGGTGAGFQVPVNTITALPTDSPGGHINVAFSEYTAVCQVSTFSIDLTREQLDTTSLPCGVGVSQGKYASFRTRQAGYADGSGTMTIRFTRNSQSIANRLLANSMLRSQAGASVKLYIDAVSNGDAINPQPDDTKSNFFAAPVSILGFSTNVSPENPTEATLNFSISGTPTHIGTLDL
jgi:hypothetical protein